MAARGGRWSPGSRGCPAKGGGRGSGSGAAEATHAEVYGALLTGRGHGQQLGQVRVAAIVLDLSVDDAARDLQCLVPGGHRGADGGRHGGGGAERRRRGERAAAGPESGGGPGSGAAPTHTDRRREPPLRTPPNPGRPRAADAVPPSGGRGGVGRGCGGGGGRGAAGRCGRRASERVQRRAQGPFRGHARRLRAEVQGQEPP